MTNSILTFFFYVFCRDREIQFYDLSTLNPYCQINAMETIPLSLNYRSALILSSLTTICHLKSTDEPTGDSLCVFFLSYISPDKYCILYGDAEVKIKQNHT